MANNETRIVILGTGAFAPVVADIISDIPGYKVCGFIENMDRTKCGQAIEGLPVHWIDDSADLVEDHLAICCLGTTKRHIFTDQAKKLGFTFATIVHPMSRISKKSTLGEGCLIAPGVVICSNTHLGAHVRVNRGALIGHDTFIEDFVTIQPGANIAGKCRIGQCCYIGMSATIIDGLNIGHHSVIGAGAVVIKDIPERIMAVGVPARIVKENIDGM